MRWRAGALHLSVNGQIAGTIGATISTGFNWLRIGGREDTPRPLNGRLLGVWLGADGNISDAKFAQMTVLGADVDAILRS
ncbi:hypothetical protein [Belnapia moabensis]|uniref:hypothetical protein n=1 Tax=Belnapia moabensis TaxID=365533 RepID=UPI0005BCD0C2|nr:hypothetical protein [Belnapia moabensis]